MIRKFMPAVTALILVCFAAYCVALYLGRIEGDMAGLLLVATVVTFAYWLAERFYFAAQRRAEAQAVIDAVQRRRDELLAQGVTPDEGALQAQAAHGGGLAQPWWLDWTAGLFPVILIVFLLRSFMFEPFKIPSGSMIPTLLVGDLILVNKFTYGLRLPVVNTRLTEGNPIQRGDVVVFHFPPKPSQDYIKRVIGVPGDEVAYQNKRLTVNGQLAPQTALSDFFDEPAMTYSKQFDEDLNGKKHRILVNDQRPAFVVGADEFKYKENCRYNVEGFVCKVPPGNYFMMGDNRDNSLDSRYWGFVPDANIVGKAFVVWMNFGDLKRIGTFD